VVCGLVRQIPSGLRPPDHDNQVKNKSAQLPLISRSYEDECFAKRPVQLAVGSATAFFSEWSQDRDGKLPIGRFYAER